MLSYSCCSALFAVKEKSIGAELAQKVVNRYVRASAWMMWNFDVPNPIHQKKSFHFNHITGNDTVTSLQTLWLPCELSKKYWSIVLTIVEQRICGINSSKFYQIREEKCDPISSFRFFPLLFLGVRWPKPFDHLHCKRRLVRGTLWEEREVCYLLKDLAKKRNPKRRWKRLPTPKISKIYQCFLSSTTRTMWTIASCPSLLSHRLWYSLSVRRLRYICITLESPGVLHLHQTHEEAIHWESLRMSLTRAPHFVSTYGQATGDISVFDLHGLTVPAGKCGLHKVNNKWMLTETKWSSEAGKGWPQQQQQQQQGNVPYYDWFNASK